MTEMTAWPVPEITKADQVFPAHSLDWIPKWDDIPAEFKRRNEWTDIADALFRTRSFGTAFVSPDIEFHPKPGIDAEKAYNVVIALLDSYAPKHQHKIAGAAFVMSQWFEKIEKWRP